MNLLKIKIFFIIQFIFVCTFFVSQSVDATWTTPPSIYSIGGSWGDASGTIDGDVWVGNYYLREVPYAEVTYDMGQTQTISQVRTNIGNIDGDPHFSGYGSEEGSAPSIDVYVSNDPGNFPATPALDDWVPESLRTFEESPVFSAVGRYVKFEFSDGGFDVKNYNQNYNSGSGSNCMTFSGYSTYTYYGGCYYYTGSGSGSSETTTTTEILDPHVSEVWVFATSSLQDIIIPYPDPTKIDTRTTEGYMSVTDGTLNAATAVGTNVNVTYRIDSADVIFPTGTSTTRNGGGAFDFEQFTMSDVTDTVRSEYPDSRVAFDLGVSGENLNFSPGVNVIVNVGGAFNGQELDILYQNAGSSTWTAHDTPTCTVANGECTFTTDHATIYTVNGEHSVTGAAPMDINVEVQDTLSLDCYETGNGSGDHMVTLGDSVTGSGYVVAGISSVGQSTCDVTTNDDQGYFLTIDRSTEDVIWAGANGSGQHATASNVLIHEDPNIDGVWYEISDLGNGLNIYTGSNAVTWNEGITKGLGFSVINFPDSNTANNILDDNWELAGTRCLDGSNAGTDTAKYAAVPTAPYPIAAVTQYNETLTTTDICYKVDVLASQQSGQYAGQVTYTATSDASGYYTN